MNILVTGAKGYIARNLIRLLPQYNFTKVDHENVDLTDTKSVNNLFLNKYFDVVIHTAVSGGKRIRKQDPNCLYDNIVMHNNLIRNEEKFSKFIHFGSGAEFDRNTNIDEKSVLENSFPNDAYDLSKNIIARTSSSNPKFYNVRIYNVFNYDELDTRMIKSNILRYIKKEPMKIHQDKIMDFFFMDDLIKILEFIIEDKLSNKTINCCYRNHYNLTEIAHIINNLSEHNVPIDIDDTQIGTSYYGQCNIPENIKLKGLFFGIKDSYEKILEEYK
jgi:nucleoside-diphosphate-sugar epimerase